MKPKLFDRRKFISSSVALFALSACKKELNAITLPPSKTSSPPVLSGGDNSPELPDAFLEQFGVTELGPVLAVLPDYFEKLTYGYANKLSYSPGDVVDLYLTGPYNASKQISLTDSNGNVYLSFTTEITKQKVNSEKPW